MFGTSNINGMRAGVVTRDTPYPLTPLLIDGIELYDLEKSSNALFLMCQSVGLRTRMQLTDDMTPFSHWQTDEVVTIDFIYI